MPPEAGAAPAGLARPAVEQQQTATPVLIGGQAGVRAVAAEEPMSATAACNAAGMVEHTVPVAAVRPLASAEMAAPAARVSLF